MASKAPTPAPPEMPRMYGSANGLRNSTCINAPANASKPPQPKAASVRGKRKSRITAADGALGSINPATTSANGIFTLPTDNPMAIAPSAKSARAINTSSSRRGEVIDKV